jgi:hypothetical protein
METTNKNINIGCASPLAVIVFLAFFFAKIYDKIDWSWWWVFSPLWIPLLFIIIITIVIIIFKIWIEW